MQLRLTREQEEEKTKLEGTIEEAEFEADQEEDEALKKEKQAEVASRKAKLDELLEGFEARAPKWRGGDDQAVGRHAVKSIHFRATTFSSRCGTDEHAVVLTRCAAVKYSAVVLSL